MTKDLVLAITGASGAVYAVRLLDVLLSSGQRVHLTISPAATQVFREELGLKLDLDNFDPSQFLLPTGGLAESLLSERGAPAGSSSIFSESDIATEELIYHHYRDFSAGIASGSFLTKGMVICPCSMGTLASIANGLSSNLIHRAADVHLKERRKLIVVPRETPLGSIQLGNMKQLADVGAVVLPAMPGFYHNPMSMHDLIDFVVARICDQLGIERTLIPAGAQTPMSKLDLSEEFEQKDLLCLDWEIRAIAFKMILVATVRGMALTFSTAQRFCTG